MHVTTKNTSNFCYTFHLMCWTFFYFYLQECFNVSETLLGKNMNDLGAFNATIFCSFQYKSIKVFLEYMYMFWKLVYVTLSSSALAQKYVNKIKRGCGETVSPETLPLQVFFYNLLETDTCCVLTDKLPVWCPPSLPLIQMQFQF